MLGLFKRAARQPGADTAGLGSSVVALPLEAGCAVPPACTGVVVDRNGRTRRVDEGARPTLAQGETAWCFHPGPYTADLTPFAAAPELGLRVGFAVDGPDPRAIQQRFDLYLASEASGRTGLASFVQSMETALRRELAQGNLDLPPCTTLEEWNAFRAGFNQLLYTRFGVTVDDCVPVDLGATCDYAQLLQARVASEAPGGMPAPAAVPAAPEAFDVADADARALRRLFLELPCVMCGVRLAVLPPGQELFRQHQMLLNRLDQVSLSVGTMPALELAAPGQPLAPAEQVRRARHSRRAVGALDEAWALLARLKGATDDRLPELFDEADRIIANLEHDSAARRLAVAQGEAA